MVALLGGSRAAPVLSPDPVDLFPGFRAWHNNNGYTAVLLHFDSDPYSASKEQRHVGLDEEKYRREHELDFSSWAGKPVLRGFKKSFIREDIGVTEDIPIWRGWDFGYHRPAVSYVSLHGSFWVIGELLGQDMHLSEFLDKCVLPYEESLFGKDRAKIKFLDAADPAGRQVSDKSEHTSFAILSQYGVFPYARRSEINEGLTVLRTHLLDGTFAVHPRCRIIVEALNGGYRYPEPTVGSPEPLFPLKDGYFEHLMDTLRYICVNSGDLWNLRGKKNPEEEKTTDRVENQLMSTRSQYIDEEFLEEQ